jgi:hypothetical protein
MEKTLKHFLKEEGEPMSNVTHFAQTVQRIVGEEADRLARETGFIERERAISGADFVQALILGWLQEPEITLDGLTQVLQRREVSITASGLSQRFTEEAASLLQRVLERLSAEQMHVEAVEIGLLRQFSAVIVEDSSSIVLPPALAEVWRGCGGSAGMSEAAIKLFVRLRCALRRVARAGTERRTSQRQAGTLCLRGLARRVPVCGRSRFFRGAAPGHDRSGHARPAAQQALLCEPMAAQDGALDALRSSHRPARHPAEAG